MEKKVVLSGIRATGRMHLGNLIGAIQDFVELAKNPDYDCFYFIANLHTLTTRGDPDAIKRDLRGIVLDYLAAGLDPETVTIYAQSSIPEITELSWLLACQTGVSQLTDMHHWRDKKNRLEQEGLTANAGLLTYPVLMAADILAPRANIVPVGIDQHQHVELARDLARRCNYRYNTDLFTIPDLLDREGVKVPGLDGSGKMGKSEDGRATIYLNDPEEMITRKIMEAVTDTDRKRRTDAGDPGRCPFFAFHPLLSTKDEILHVQNGCRDASIGCRDCKRVVADHVLTILKPFQERRRAVESDHERRIDEILHEGGTRARRRIKETVDRAKDLMGVPAF
ncbi:MAG TPA: tryptophan--tRNA ligase [Patescibacteria group bacterium]|nr:tryptophan--tRNA ligase [Patescibacteria group bacterium]